MILPNPNPLTSGLRYLFTWTNWTGQHGFWERIIEHLEYTFIAVALSTVIALILGILLARYKNKYTNIFITTINSTRAIPSLGVITFAVIEGWDPFISSMVALLLLGIPPILANTYSGIESIDPDSVPAATALGLSGLQTWTKVILPQTYVPILQGVRIATLNIIATVLICAYVNLGGLGQIIFTGLSVYNYAMIFSAAIVIAVLALIIDAILTIIIRMITI